MALKQAPNCLQAPDGSFYVALTDGAGNLVSPGGGTAANITVGTTTITGGADTDILFNNAGVIGNDAGFQKVAGATGLVKLNNGGNSTVQLQFTPNSGVNTGIGMANGGTQMVIYGNTGATQFLGISGSLVVASNGALKWSTGATVTSTNDTGIARSAAGIVEINTSTAGSPGQLQYSDPVVIKTTNYQVAKTDNGFILTNTGAAGEVDFTLPTSANTSIGMRYAFYVSTAQILKVVANTGVTIRVAGNVSSSAGNITNSTIGGFIEIVAITTTSWVAKGAQGTWTTA